MDTLITTKKELALDALLAEDSTFYGDLFPHAVQWHGELYLEDGLHRALRAALQQRNVIHVRVLDLDALMTPRPARPPSRSRRPTGAPIALAQPPVGPSRPRAGAGPRRRLSYSQPFSSRHPRRLDPGPRAGLADRRGQVVAHRPLGQEQPAGDVGDGGAVRGGAQDVGLPRRQRRGAEGQRRGGQVAVDHPLPRHHRPDRRGPARPPARP